MIKKSIIFALSLLVVYNIILIVWKPAYYIPQNQFQENVIKAQKFIYSGDNKNNVIVGSSLSTKIDMNVLPDNFYNLSFRGQSIYDGLEIIKRSGNKPSTIFIETNILLREPDADFTEKLFTPFFSSIKSNVPSFQEANQPVNTFTLLGFEVFSLTNPAMAEYIKKKYGVRTKSGNETNDGSFEKNAKVIAQVERNLLFKKIVDERIKEFSSIPNAKKVSKRISLLRQYTDYFLKKGIKIVFFEMPMEVELSNSPLSNYIRNEIDKNFPSDKITFLSAPDCRYFQTRDGIHLVDESGTLYAMYLNEKAYEINNHKVVNKTSYVGHD